MLLRTFLEVRKGKFSWQKQNKQKQATLRKAPRPCLQYFQYLSVFLVRWGQFCSALALCLQDAHKLIHPA